MTSLSAYYLWVVTENERKLADRRAAQRFPRPSLLARLSAVIDGLRARPSAPRPA